jgi:hypothetical protein
MDDWHYLFRRKQLSVPTCILMAEWWKGVVCQARFEAFFSPCAMWRSSGRGFRPQME